MYKSRCVSVQLRQMDTYILKGFLSVQFLHEFLSVQFLHVDVLVTFVLHSLSSHVGIQPFPTRAYWTMFACLQVAHQLC